MRLAAFILSMSISTLTWANPLILKCKINKQTTVINVESLISNGCQDKIVNAGTGQVQTRYKVTLCHGQHAAGIVEALTIHGEWVSVGEFSTDRNCYLYREIATNYQCTPNRHRRGCQ